MKWRALWLLVRPTRSDFSTTLLPIITFAVIGMVVFFVTALARIFWVVQDSTDGYKILAVALLAVLLVPIASLGSSAAQLSARRRDERLATLRLIGASARWVRSTALIEASMLAAAGVVIGILGYWLIAPLLSLLVVAGVQVPLGAVWLPLVWIPFLGFAVVSVAIISAVSGLRQVVISPLGVRARVDAPRIHWVRLLISVALVIAAIILLQSVSVSWGAIGITAAIVGVLLAVMVAQNVAGPFVVRLVARRKLGVATTAAELIAARGILESPKSIWRQVSGVALTSFIVVPVGAVLGYLNFIETSVGILTAQQILFFGDIRTIILAVVFLSFVLVVCSVVIIQSAAVLERRDLYVSLSRIGMKVDVIHASRRISLMLALKVASIGSAILASTLVSPVLAVVAFNSPLFILATILCIVTGVWLVRLSLLSTRPLLRSILANPDRAL